MIPMDLSIVDWVKIGITIASILSLWYFRRQIVKVITDIMISGDSSKYQCKDVSEILEEIDKRINEVVE